MSITFLPRPNKLTYWASQNIRLAMALIILIEIVKFGIGFYLGKNALPIISSNSASIFVLIIAISSFVFQSFFSEKAQSISRKAAFPYVFKGNLILFISSFLLSSIVGNQWTRIENPTDKAAVFATLTVEHRNDINVDSLLQAVEEEQRLSISQKPTKEEVSSNDDLKRLGYFLLFVLATLLTYFGLILACSIACSGYGVLAVLVLLLDVGIFSGGIYFLLKVFRKGKIKKWKEMSKPERKKEWRRYLKTLLFTVGALATFILLANILG